MGKTIGILGMLVLIFLISSVYGIEIKEKKTIDRRLETEYAPNEILVKFKEGILPNEIENILQEFGVSQISEIKKLKVKHLKIPSGIPVLEMVEKIKKNPFVEFAEPNYIAYALMVPNDPYYSYQWHFDNAVYGGIHMESAWDITTGNSNVVVAVLDTGIAYEDYCETPGKCYYLAPDLVGTCFVSSYDFVNNDVHANDDNSHGTHVAGTIAQTTNNNLGVAGIAFNTCIMPVKVLNKQGSGTHAQIANGIIYATDNEAKIISMSLGGPGSTTLENAISYAYNNGVTIISACGNDNIPSCDYPARYDSYVIAVGATQYDETRAPYSSYGTGLDIVAPGGNTGVDQNGDGYVDGVLQQTFNPTTKNTQDFGYWFFQGTSMATPHVAGVAALLLAINPLLPPDDIRNILQTTADDLGSAGYDTIFGYGLLNAYAAVGELDTTIWVNPNYQEIVNGNSFSISIDIDTIENAYAAQFDLYFDASILEAVSVTEGNFFNQGGASTIFSGGSIDNINGKINDVYVSRYATLVGVSGTGTIAEITFNTKNTGTSVLNLDEVIISDDTYPLPQPIPYVIVNDGNVDVIAAAISITFSGGPIAFGSVEPGTYGSGGTYSIDIVTSENVDVYQYGDNYCSDYPTCAGNQIPISEMKWDDTNNYASSTSVASLYSLLDYLTGVGTGNYPIYYWLNIPSGQAADTYTSQIYIKAVTGGTSPSSSPAPLSSSQPQPIPNQITKIEEQTEETEQQSTKQGGASVIVTKLPPIKLN